MKSLVLSLFIITLALAAAHTHAASEAFSAFDMAERVLADHEDHADDEHHDEDDDMHDDEHEGDEH